MALITVQFGTGIVLNSSLILRLLLSLVTLCAAIAGGGAWEWDNWMGTHDLVTPCMLQQDAMSVNQLVQQLKQQDALVSEGATHGESLWKLIDRVVFIDSTWSQTHSILRVSYSFLTVCRVCTYYACGRGTRQFFLPCPHSQAYPLSSFWSLSLFPELQFCSSLIPRPSHHPALISVYCNRPKPGWEGLGMRLIPMNACQTGQAWQLANISSCCNFIQTEKKRHHWKTLASYPGSFPLTGTWK